MPELPEVETIKRGLQELLRGQIIQSVEVLHTKSMPATTEVINEHIISTTVQKVWRRGKVLGIDLDSGYSMLVHLKMTGQLVFDYGQKQTLNPKHETLNPSTSLRAGKSENKNDKNERNDLEFSDSNFEFGNAVRVAGGHPTKSMAAELPDNSTRVIFTFRDGSKLYFNDQRKFGWMKVVESSKVKSEKFFETMGPEPLEPEFQISNFKFRIKSRKAPIKAILLDQDTAAGLGNIYTDEALHLAKIHPLRAGHTLSAEEVERLHAAIIEVLQNSINDGGTSFTNYVNAGGITGDYLSNARVYRREGQPCPECGASIEKIKVAQRGTHICPQCQLLDKR